MNFRERERERNFFVVWNLGDLFISRFHRIWRLLNKLSASDESSSKTLLQAFFARISYEWNPGYDRSQVIFGNLGIFNLIKSDIVSIEMLQAVTYSKLKMPEIKSAKEATRFHIYF